MGNLYILTRPREYLLIEQRYPTLLIGGQFVADLPRLMKQESRTVRV